MARVDQFNTNNQLGRPTQRQATPSNEEQQFLNRLSTLEGRVANVESEESSSAATPSTGGTLNVPTSAQFNNILGIEKKLLATSSTLDNIIVPIDGIEQVFTNSLIWNFQPSAILGYGDVEGGNNRALTFKNHLQDIQDTSLFIEFFDSENRLIGSEYIAKSGVTKVILKEILTVNIEYIYIHYEQQSVIQRTIKLSVDNSITTINDGFTTGTYIKVSSAKAKEVVSSIGAGADGVVDGIDLSIIGDRLNTTLNRSVGVDLSDSVQLPSLPTTEELVDDINTSDSLSDKIDYNEGIKDLPPDPHSIILDGLHIEETDNLVRKVDILPSIGTQCEQVEFNDEIYTWFDEGQEASNSPAQNVLTGNSKMLAYGVGGLSSTVQNSSESSWVYGYNFHTGINNSSLNFVIREEIGVDDLTGWTIDYEIYGSSPLSGSLDVKAFAVQETDSTYNYYAQSVAGYVANSLFIAQLKNAGNVVVASYTGGEGAWLTGDITGDDPCTNEEIREVTALPSTGEQCEQLVFNDKVYTFFETLVNNLVFNTLYMSGGTPAAVYTVNRNTSVATRVGNSSNFGVNETLPKDLASIDSTLYMLGRDNDWLYRLDTITGVAQRVGASNQFGVSEGVPLGLAASGQNLYMVGGNRILYLINTTTGAATQVGTHGAGFGIGLAQNPTGLAFIGSTLYMITSDALYILNTITGGATRIGTLENFGVGETLANGLAAIDETLYMVGATHDRLYTLDTTTGRATRVGESTRFGVNQTSPTGLGTVTRIGEPTHVVATDGYWVLNADLGDMPTCTKTINSLSLGAVEGRIRALVENYNLIANPDLQIPLSKLGNIPLEDWANRNFPDLQIPDSKLNNIHLKKAFADITEQEINQYFTNSDLHTRYTPTNDPQAFSAIHGIPGNYYNPTSDQDQDNFALRQVLGLKLGCSFASNINFNHVYFGVANHGHTAGQSTIAHWEVCAKSGLTAVGVQNTGLRYIEYIVTQDLDAKPRAFKRNNINLTNQPNGRGWSEIYPDFLYKTLTQLDNDVASNRQEIADNVTDISENSVAIATIEARTPIQAPIQELSLEDGGGVQAFWLYDTPFNIQQAINDGYRFMLLNSYDYSNQGDYSKNSGAVWHRILLADLMQLNPTVRHDVVTNEFVKSTDNSSNNKVLVIPIIHQYNSISHLISGVPESLYLGRTSANMMLAGSQNTDFDPHIRVTYE